MTDGITSHVVLSSHQHILYGYTAGERFLTNVYILDIQYLEKLITFSYHQCICIYIYDPAPPGSPPPPPPKGGYVTHMQPCIGITICLY